MDGRGTRRKVASAATASIAVLALLGFAAFELTGRVDHTAASHMTASHVAASQITASPAADQTAKATASARTAATPASPRPSKTRDRAKGQTKDRAKDRTREKRTPSRKPSAPSSVLAPVSTAAFGPNGTADGDHPGHASLVLTDPALGWTTQWYATPEFGELKTGTGLLLDMGRPVTITTVLVGLGRQHGADLELRGGPTRTDLRALAGAANVGGGVDLPLSQPASARYILLWFTKLPPDGVGTYQVAVHRITVYGEP